MNSEVAHRAAWRAADHPFQRPPRGPRGHAYCWVGRHHQPEHLVLLGGRCWDCLHAADRAATAATAVSMIRAGRRDDAFVVLALAVDRQARREDLHLAGAPPIAAMARFVTITRARFRGGSSAASRVRLLGHLAEPGRARPGRRGGGEHPVTLSPNKLLPGRAGNCRRCGRPVVFARTVASERGPGGRPMPLDPMPNPEGRIAVSVVGTRTLRARTLAADETHDHTCEVLAMTHFATCGARELVKGAEELLRQSSTPDPQSRREDPQ